MRTKMILVAVHALVGSAPDGDGGPQSFNAPSGTEITPDVAEKLGLDDAAMLKLLSTGAIAQRSVREQGDAHELSDETADGITIEEFRDFLTRNGATVPDDALVDDLLVIDLGGGGAAATLAYVRQLIEARGVVLTADASIEEMIDRAIEFGQPGDLDAAANKIERELKAEEIKAELTDLEIPFETDANKPALAMLLARVRASSGPPGG